MGSFITFKTDASGASKVVAGPGIILLALVASVAGCRPSSSSSPAPPPSLASGRTAPPATAARAPPAVPGQARARGDGGPPKLGARFRPPLPRHLCTARTEERCRVGSVPARRRGRRAVPEPGRRDPSDGGGPTEAGGYGVEGVAA